jgi:hypothetical protein
MKRLKKKVARETRELTRITRGSTHAADRKTGRKIMRRGFEVIPARGRVVVTPELVQKILGQPDA